MAPANRHEMREERAACAGRGHSTLSLAKYLEYKTFDKGRSSNALDAVSSDSIHVHISVFYMQPYNQPQISISIYTLRRIDKSAAGLAVQRQRSKDTSNDGTSDERARWVAIQRQQSNSGDLDLTKITHFPLMVSYQSVKA